MSQIEALSVTSSPPLPGPGPTRPGRLPSPASLGRHQYWPGPGPNSVRQESRSGLSPGPGRPNPGPDGISSPDSGPGPRALEPGQPVGYELNDFFSLFGSVSLRDLVVSGFA